MASYKTRIRSWNVADGTLVLDNTSIKCRGNTSASLSYSSDGELVLISSSTAIQVWNVAMGALLPWEVSIDHDRVLHIDWVPSAFGPKWFKYSHDAPNYLLDVYSTYDGEIEMSAYNSAMELAAIIVQDVDVHLVTNDAGGEVSVCAGIDGSQFYVHSEPLQDVLHKLHKQRLPLQIIYQAESPAFGDSAQPVEIWAPDAQTLAIITSENVELLNLDDADTKERVRSQERADLPIPAVSKDGKSFAILEIKEHTLSDFTVHVWTTSHTSRSTTFDFSDQQPFPTMSFTLVKNMLDVDELPLELPSPFYLTWLADGTHLLVVTVGPKLGRLHAPHVYHIIVWNAQTNQRDIDLYCTAWSLLDNNDGFCYSFPNAEGTSALGTWSCTESTFLRLQCPFAWEFHPVLSLRLSSCHSILAAVCPFPLSAMMKLSVWNVGSNLLIKTWEHRGLPVAEPYPLLHNLAFNE